MHIDVYRMHETDDSTTGEMEVDGQYECDTLEPSLLKPLHPGHPRIPAGTYKVRLSFSPHFKAVTPEVLDVPGREYIRIHPANQPSELLGCTAVGEDVGKPDWVAESRKAFDRLMALLRNYSDELDITYHDIQ